jgi:hypothetical protein
MGERAAISQQSVAAIPVFTIPVYWLLTSSQYSKGHQAMKESSRRGMLQAWTAAKTNPCITYPEEGKEETEEKTT